MKKLITLALCMFTTFTFAMRGHSNLSEPLFKLDDNSVSYSTQFEVYSFLMDVEEILPESLKDSIDGQITVSFRPGSDFDKKANGTVLGWTKKKSMFGSYKKIDSIVLNEMFIDGIINNDSDLIEKATKTLVHEATHIYDYRDVLLGNEKKYDDYCNALPRVVIKRTNNKNTYGPSDKNCIKFQKAKRSVSESPMFLTLAGWNLQGVLVKKRRQLNNDFTRSPDQYEYTNPSEFFAVNMEYFLTDKNYQCRRPTLYRYYSELFDHVPYDESECDMYSKLTINASAWKNTRPTLADLDLDRLYQVHYLFASEGEQVMSKWGHAMFRLVMCRPGREVGPDCLNDIAHHIVVNFRANVTDSNIDYLKGLKGDYPSEVIILNMKDVIDEYTKGEFRDLVSIPLKYSQNQKDYFLKSVLEQYWSYSGKYYFITNNCATEAMRLIRITNYGNYSYQNRDVFSPLGIMDELKEFNIGDFSVLKDHDEAIRMGYLFPGENDRIKRNFNALKSVIDIDYKNFKKFIKNSKSNERATYIAMLEEKFSGKELRTYLAKLLQLETYMSEIFSTQYSKELAKFSKEEQKDTVEGMLEKVNEFQELQKSIIVESSVSEGYGIPLVDEVTELSQEEYEETSQNLSKISDELTDMVNEFFPELTYELTSIFDNRIAIKRAMFKTI